MAAEEVEDEISNDGFFTLTTENMDAAGNNSSDEGSMSSVRTIETTVTTTKLGGAEIHTVSRKRRTRKSRQRNSRMVRDKMNPEHWSLVGSGECGVPECQDILPEGSDRVLYGLVQIKIGSGTFQRTKNVFIHFNGINTPGMVKAYAAEKHNEIHQAFGQIHASICVEDKADFTIDYIFKTLGNIFSSDDITVNSKFATTLTIEEMREQYKREMEEKRSEFLARQLAASQAGAPTPSMEPELIISEKKDRIQEILDIVRADTGWINWVLFKPTNKKLRLYDTDSFGDGSIFALAEALPEDHCVYGLLRMSFGVQPYRRTHIVQFQWVGPETKRIKRGQDMAKADNMARLLAPYGMTIQLGFKEHVNVENIIMRVRRVIDIDGDVEDDEELVRLRLIQEYQSALEEEQRMNENHNRTLEADMEEEAGGLKEVRPEATIGEDQDGSSTGERMREDTTVNISETIELVTNPESCHNWVMLEPLRKNLKRAHGPRGYKKKGNYAGRVVNRTQTSPN